MVGSCTAENIRKIMDERGLKYSVIAERAGYSQGQFSAMINGRKVIKDTDVAAIAKALEVGPGELFG